jgi:deoxyribodipyrimidine photo-lyase
MTDKTTKTNKTKTTYDIGIFIFRRDMRIIDNRGLIKMSTYTKNIIPIFIFDPYQVDLNSNTKNYLSFPALKFICECLTSLHNDIKKEKSLLHIFYGKPEIVIRYIIKTLRKTKFKNSTICLGFNEDFSAYSIQRDSNIKKICLDNLIDVISVDDDYTLCSMDLLLKNDGNPYKQYGAFNKSMLSQKNIFNKSTNKKVNFYTKTIKFDKSMSIKSIDVFWEDYIDLTKYNPVEIGGRPNALKILSQIKFFNEYNEKRDTLSYSTTRLSAHLNFGTISERELYEEIVNHLGNKSLLINQIIWRDYYLTLLRYLPIANSYNLHIDNRFNKIKWLDNYTLEVKDNLTNSTTLANSSTINNLTNLSNIKFKSEKNKRSYREWELMMQSQTGFLLVDAALKEILTTGYMHNRCRLIVGVFSVKYLLINPLCRYVGLHDWFSRNLVDCITSQNKLNCQWTTELDFPGKKFAPSSSVIAGRPMSISNLMIKKWDPTCEYIKKWLPHLANIDNKILYNWDTKFDKSIHPKPIFDSKQRYKEWIKLCANN